MDEETRQRIFERFYRAEAAARVAGTGLGMSIVKEIIDIHGGRIDVESAPGKGTTFTLTFPARQAEVGQDEAAKATDVAPVEEGEATTAMKKAIA
jgi:signal transduction histidine kinase